MEQDAASTLLDEVLSLLLGASCTGCDEPGRLLCASCRARLGPAPVRRSPVSGIPVTAALPFEGVAARCIRAVKENGITLLARPLGAALGAVLPDDPAVLLVPVPTSRRAFRRRGYRVPDLLIRAAGGRPVRLLGAAGTVRDQRGLGRVERARNVEGSMRARRRGDGAEVVVVDDVITTRATLAEAVRVLQEAGFHVRGAIALAATPRQGELIGDTEEMGDDIPPNADYGRGSQGDHGPPLAGRTGTRRHEWKRASSASE
ncbi:ComF family protein [Microbacterium sp. CIAB417]|uniref:ComF family protein n=1 Tax=Microbacterium sp. CIAB417 TaxID=2860287 RepID=UPI001FAC246C|nr:ComF family protein [Microbacterium sp. CIAB417]